MTPRVEEVAGSVTSDLRRAVLRPTWAPGTPMPADNDPGGVHVAAFVGDDVVGACVLFATAYPRRPAEHGAWQLRGMATADGRRGQGIGSAVLAGALHALRVRGARLVWCNARVTAVPFYARAGFAVDGEEFVQSETGLPHRTMWRLLEP